MDRRRFIRNLASVAATGLLTAHHRPGHDRGPPKRGETFTYPLVDKSPLADSGAAVLGGRGDRMATSDRGVWVAPHHWVGITDSVSWTMT